MTAADLARALHLQPAGRGVWRGPCPICGGARLALERAPEAEAAWFKQNRPELFHALLHAWARQQRRWRTARLVEAAAVEAEVGV